MTQRPKNLVSTTQLAKKVTFLSPKLNAVTFVRDFIFENAVPFQRWNGRIYLNAEAQAEFWKKIDADYLRSKAMHCVVFYDWVLRRRIKPMIQDIIEGGGKKCVREYNRIRKFFNTRPIEYFLELQELHEIFLRDIVPKNDHLMNNLHRQDCVAQLSELHEFIALKHIVAELPAYRALLQMPELIQKILQME